MNAKRDEAEEQRRLEAIALRVVRGEVGIFEAIFEAAEKAEKTSEDRS